MAPSVEGRPSHLEVEFAVIDDIQSLDAFSELAAIRTQELDRGRTGGVVHACGDGSDSRGDSLGSLAGAAGIAGTLVSEAAASAHQGTSQAGAGEMTVGGDLVRHS